jgi:hypothetical protein
MRKLMFGFVIAASLFTVGCKKKGADKPAAKPGDTSTTTPTPAEPAAATPDDKKPDDQKAGGW